MGAVDADSGTLSAEIGELEAACGVSEVALLLTAVGAAGPAVEVWKDENS